MRTFVRVLILSFLLFVSGAAMAQRFRAGFTAGLNASTINGTQPGNFPRKVGLIAGGVMNYALTPKSSFQMELTFIQKGSLNPPDSLGNGYSKIALAYVEMPLLIRRRIKFNVSKRPVTGFELEFGLSVARLISVTSVNFQNATLPTDNIFNNYEASLLAGLNYHISKNIYFNLRYSNSFIPAVKRNIPYFNPFFTYTWNRGNNMVLQFSFKFIFGGVAQSNESPAEVPQEN